MSESTNPKDKIGKTKPPFHLIPTTALVHEAVVMGLGADKYGPYNWRDKTVAASVYISAAYRHLASWFDGENYDEESKASHLAHARACLAIILDAKAQGMLVDDRPEAGKTAQLIKEFTKPTLPTIEFSKIIDVKWINHVDTYSQGLWCDDKGLSSFWETIGCGNLDIANILSEAIKYPSPQWNRKTVYISGPMRGIEKFNFPAFDAARDRFLEAGWAVISPADIDRLCGVKESEDTNPQFDPATSRSFVYRDFFSLFALKGENGDAVAMLPVWEHSTGATAEFFLARWLGLTVLNARTTRPLSNHDFSGTDLSNKVHRYIADSARGSANNE